MAGTGEPADPATEAAVMYDHHRLYVALSCREPRMDRIAADETARDGPLWRDDCVELFLAHRGNDTVYYHMIANALGAVWDGRHDKAVIDASWNAGVEAGACRERDRYTVEIGVPFKDVAPRPPRRGDVWKIKLCRHMTAPVRDASWPVSFRGFACRPVYWADLRFQ
jgi:hypothetical protein